MNGTTTAILDCPWDCEARAEYIRVRPLSAFNVRGYVKVRRNGASSTYLFRDGSKLVIGVNGWNRYHGRDGLPVVMCDRGWASGPAARGER